MIIGIVYNYLIKWWSFTPPFYMYMNDESIMIFGKHKGKALRDVPHSWFVYMHDRGKLTGQLKAYAEQAVPILRFVAEKNNVERDGSKSRTEDDTE